LPRLRQLVVRLSEEELRETRGTAASAGLSVGAQAGQKAFAAARTAAADAEFAVRAVVRVLVDAQAAGWAGDDDVLAALVDQMVAVLVARLS
jgi:hypothetical protein